MGDKEFSHVIRTVPNPYTASPGDLDSLQPSMRAYAVYTEYSLAVHVSTFPSSSSKHTFSERARIHTCTHKRTRTHTYTHTYIRTHITPRAALPRYGTGSLR